MPYHNNEDAGDLTAMGRADYDGEMAEQSDHARRLAYVDRFDAVTAATVWPHDGECHIFSFGRAHGPSEAPFCDACCVQLRRDDAEGRYTGDNSAQLFCSEACETRYALIPCYDDGREFPTYG